jgi:hypothetical protein
MPSEGLYVNTVWGNSAEGIAGTIGAVMITHMFDILQIVTAKIKKDFCRKF